MNVVAGPNLAAAVTHAQLFYPLATYSPKLLQGSNQRTQRVVWYRPIDPTNWR